VDRSALASPFLRSWWLEGAGGRGRRFVLVTEGPELIGGLAVEERRVAGVDVVRMMGAGALCPDHLDLLVAPDRRPEVLASVGAWLRRAGSRVLAFDGLRAGSDLATVVPGARSAVVARAPYAEMPADPERYLAERSANFRANMRKARRRLTEAGVAHRVVPAGDTERALATLRALHVARWGRRSRFLGSFDRFASAARAGAARGELTLHELVAQTTPIASVSCFEVAGRASLYQSGRSVDPRWRSAGSVLLLEAIQDAARRGVREVDLLRGDESYKASFASDDRELVAVQGAAGGRGRLLAAGAERYGNGRRRAAVFARSVNVARSRDDRGT
jgi:CelD/BcsL family acetyltransferase involved in cellulose biosynthesis